MTPRIALLTSSLTTGDAVSNDVIEMYRVLKRHDYDARIYAASEWTHDDTLQVWPAKGIDEYLQSPSDILLYHYSVGWPFGFELLRRAECRVCIKYHNVTPPEFFAGFSPEHELVCREGRAQLVDVARADCALYLSDSEYNMWELLVAGAEKRRSFVVPPFHHIDRLDQTAPDIRVIDAYRDGATNLLMVGRVFPNKGHLALLEAFAFYHHYYNSDSRLFVVGKEEEKLQTYSELLRERAARLRVEDAVVFTGGVSESALKSYYMIAHAFVFTSEHEGFCVPLVEAMAMKLPIVAYGSTAIAGTVGDAGLVWKEREPQLLAHSIDTLVRDESISHSLGLMGWRRYEQLFANKQIEEQFMEALGHLL